MLIYKCNHPFALSKEMVKMGFDWHPFILPAALVIGVIVTRHAGSSLFKLLGLVVGIGAAFLILRDASDTVVMVVAMLAVGLVILRLGRVKLLSGS